VSDECKRATITFRDGRVYVADRVELGKHRVTFTGRRRVRDLAGERFYDTCEMTVPQASVRAINWHRN